jgi:hypothetical protein
MVGGGVGHLGDDDITGTWNLSAGREVNESVIARTT